MIPKDFSNPQDKPKGLRNVLSMGLVSFFTDFSTEMILSVLPLFQVNNLGVSRAILGAIEGSSELTSYVFRMFSGALSDKLKTVYHLKGVILDSVQTWEILKDN